VIRAGDKFQIIVKYNDAYSSGRGVTWHGGCAVESQEFTTFDICTFSAFEVKEGDKFLMSFAIDNSAGKTAITIPNGKGIFVLASQNTGSGTSPSIFKGGNLMPLAVTGRMQYNLWSTGDALSAYYDICTDQAT